MACSKCWSKEGFAFGTCIECGWNDIEHEYKFIVVWTSNLPSRIASSLINEHDARIRQRLEDRKHIN